MTCHDVTFHWLNTQGMEADDGRGGVRQLGRAADVPSDNDGASGSDGDALPPRKSARSRAPRWRRLLISECSASCLRSVLV